jgi:uncharacterized OB-fold protein
VSEPAGVTLPARLQEVEPVRSIRTFARLEYQYTPGRAASRFLREVEKKRLVGQRCPVCKKVYVPPRGSCPVDGVATEEEVELGHSGTIVSFCVVNVPFMANLMEIPYVGALIQLDGSDIPIMHLIQEVPYDEVHPGMRSPTHRSTPTRTTHERERRRHHLVRPDQARAGGHRHQRGRDVDADPR